MSITGHPFFKQIGDDSIGPLKDSAELVEFSEGDVIFEENSLPRCLYLVLEGTVCFRKRTHSADHYTVSESRQGEYFGEIGVLTGERRSLQAVAKSRVVLARIPAEALLDYLGTIPGPILKLFQGIIGHLEHTTRHYIDDMVRKEKMAVVGTMMNSIIHDFKNPFCLISMGAQLIRQQHSDANTQKLCRNIEEQVQRMVDMASELGEFSRGQHQLRTARVNLKRLLGHFRELNAPYFSRDTVQIEFDVPEDIDLEAEPQKLLRVLQNLVSNALDAFDSRAGKITINAQLIQRNRWVRMTVADDGEGIPEDIRDQFFEPFVTYGKKNGTGLGTAIARSIIEAHGGNISFHTETGKGTTFFIDLPLRQPRERKNNLNRKLA